MALEAVLLPFQDGFAPETIVAECFPTFSLEQVYGAIAYYLGHRRRIDAYLQQADAESAAFQQATHDAAFVQQLAPSAYVCADL